MSEPKHFTDEEIEALIARLDATPCRCSEYRYDPEDYGPCQPCAGKEMLRSLLAERHQHAADERMLRERIDNERRQHDARMVEMIRGFEAERTARQGFEQKYRDEQEIVDEMREKHEADRARLAERVKRACIGELCSYNTETAIRGQHKVMRDAAVRIRALDLDALLAAEPPK